MPPTRGGGGRHASADRHLRHPLPSVEHEIDVAGSSAEYTCTRSAAQPPAAKRVKLGTVCHVHDERRRATSAATVSLLRWLRRQLREPSWEREHLEAAIANDDPREARRIVARMPFNDAQLRHVGRLLDEWERDGPS